jgi:NMD protein affecting ribosome stability and mRNA decay
MSNTTTTSGFHTQERHDRLLQEWEHDTYKSKHKPAEPTACPKCGAVFHNGRWQWDAAPADSNQSLCPACHRIQDKVPAGFLNLGGEFLAGHKEEIMGLIRHVEQREKAAHPLKRIMEVEPLEDDGMLITFTDPHLARGVGEALHDAYKGELDFAYQAEERILRVSWKR